MNTMAEWMAEWVAHCEAEQQNEVESIRTEIDALGEFMAGFASSSQMLEAAARIKSLKAELLAIGSAA